METKQGLTFVFDLETSGLPLRTGFGQVADPKRIELYENCRIVQLGYIVLNGEEEVRRQSFMVKPSGFVIPPEVTRIHNISQEKALKEGMDLSTVMDAVYRELKNCTRIVSHNIAFDYYTLLSECYRAGDTELITLLESMEKYCTMENGKRILCRRKWPRLTELYAELFPGVTWHQIHDALDDADGCARCYVKLTRIDKPVL